MKKYAMVIVLVGLIAFFAAGCFKHTYNVGNGAPNGKEVYSGWHSHWLFGIIGEKKLDIADLCPSGHATIHDEISFVNGLIGAFVGIIYYPTTVTVQCRQGKKAEIELNADEVAAILTDPNFIVFVDEVAPGMRAQAELAIDSAEDFLAAKALYAQR